MSQPMLGLNYRVTMSEIARDLARTGRSTVSNWRERKQDFPEPVVDSPRSPLFDLGEVLDWLKSPSSPLAVAPAPSVSWWWSKAVEAFQAERPGGEAREYLMALVLVHTVLVEGIAGIGPDVEAWEAASGAADPGAAFVDVAHRLERDHTELVGLLAEPLEHIDVRPAALRELGARLHAAFGRHGAPAAMDAVVVATAPSGRLVEQQDTSPAVAELMVRLADPGDGGTVFDPAGGEGGLLLAAAREAARRGRSNVLTGQEIDIGTWRIARSRLLVEGAVGDVRLGDSIDDDQWVDLRADAVVLDPPVAKGTAPLEVWVDHALVHCVDRGRVVVAIPAHAVVEVASARRHPSRSLCAALERLAAVGQVEGVVVTPRRVRSDVTGPMTLWLLRGSPADEPNVLLVAHDEDRLRVPTTPGDIPIAVDEVVASVELVRGGGRVSNARNRAATVARLVARTDVFADLEVAVSTAGTPASDTRTSVRDSRQDSREIELRSHVRQLIALVERQQETLWEHDRAEFLAARDHVNAIRRLL